MGRIVLTDDGIVLYDSGVASSTPSSPVAAPPGNITDILFHRPEPGVPFPPAPERPILNTSGEVLDFKVVGGGVPILLTGPKTIINCPAHVIVKAAQASGQSGAQNSYTIVVNGNSTFMPNVQSQYLSSNYGLDIQGPTVTVSVDSPGLQMEIQSA